MVVTRTGRTQPLDVSYVLTAGLLTMMAGCDAMRGEPEKASVQGDPDLVSLEDFGSLQRIGLEETGDPMSVFREPRDGLFLDDELIVLDASPPWLRTFDPSGRLLGSMGPEGEGPGEAENPFSLTRTQEGLLLWQAGGAVGVGPNARRVVRLPASGFTARGGRSCNGSLLSLMLEFASLDAPGLLVRVRDAGAIDTLMVLGAQRTQALQHPFFATGTGRGLLFYPEEKERDRLLEVSCDGELLREIRIDPLGPPEEWQRLEQGWQVRSAEPPFPAGLARVGNVVLWAAQDGAADGAAGESAERRTVFTAFPPDDEIHQIAIPGWFQLFSGAPDGRLMLATSDSVPHVVVMDGHELLRLMGAPMSMATPLADRREDLEGEWGEGQEGGGRSVRGS